MRSLVSRRIGLAVLAAALALPAPSVAAAVPLSAPQLATLTTMTRSYFHALQTGDVPTLAAMTTSDFKSSNLSGTGTTDLPGIVAQVIKAKAKFSGITGGITVQSAVSDGTTTTATVATQVAGNMTSGNQQYTISRNGVHNMTWLRTSGGWKLEWDLVTKRHQTI